MFEGYETDKIGWHTYDPVYERLFRERKYTIESVLELGIFRGGSLRAFRDYFPDANIYGMDIDPHTMIHGESRIETMVGSVRDPEALATAGKWGPFDLIVDDASHVTIDQYYALKRLWQHIRIGGYYIIEDLTLDRNGHELIGHVARMLRIHDTNIEIHLGTTETPADDMLILRKEG